MSIPQIVSKLSHDASRCKDKDCNLNCEYRDKLCLPGLCRIAEIAETSTETPMFYTEATFMEYHRLLVNLFVHFRLHLSALVKDQHKKKVENFNMVRYFGSALHDMVSSNIMLQHAQNIEVSLAQTMEAGQNDRKTAKADGAATKRLGVSKSSSSGVKIWPFRSNKTAVAEARDRGEGEGAGAEVIEDDFDDFAASIQFRAVEYNESDRGGEGDSALDGHLLASRCCQWLRLLTTYFDAMEILLPSGSSLQGLPKDTTVQFIALGYQGRERMKWETVCLDHLPESNKFPNGSELVAAFKKRLEKDKALSQWFKDDGTFVTDFPGTRHCEAIAASVLKHARPMGLMKELPVCYLVISSLQ